MAMDNAFHVRPECRDQRVAVGVVRFPSRLDWARTHRAERHHFDNPCEGQ